MLRERKHFRTAADQEKRWAPPPSCFTQRNNRESGPIILPQKWRTSREKTNLLGATTELMLRNVTAAKRRWELITQPFSDTGVLSFERSLIYFPAAV